MAKTKIIDPETEEVALTEEQIATVQKEIHSTLVKRNVTDSLIKEYRDKYMGLTINGIEDKEGYDIVYQARQTAKNTRILVKTICKDGRATLQAKAKQWIAKEKELTAQIEEIEDHLQAQEDAYQAEKDRIKAEKKAAEAKRLIDRTTQLSEMGVTFNGAEYVLDAVAYDLDVIRESDDGQWDNIIIPKYKVIFDAKEKIRIANEKALQEERERQEKIQLEILERERLLKEQEDAFKKQKEETEKKRKEELAARTKRRSIQLESMGLKYNFQTEKHELRAITVGRDPVEALDDAEWDVLVNEIAPKIDAIKMEIKSEKDAEQDRLNQAAIERAEIERKQQDELRRQREREELEEGKDVDRWAFFLKMLPKEFPVMESPQYKRMIEDAQGKIEYIRSLKATRKSYKATV